MATGDLVGMVTEVMFPDSNPAGIAIRQGGSTQAENIRVWTFDNSSDEYLDFKVSLRGYSDSGGVTVDLEWGAATATSGNVEWKAAMRVIKDDAEDIDASHTYVYNSVTDVAPSVSGEFVMATITFDHGADMDSWQDGETAILRVTRETTGVSGNMSGDAQLLNPPFVIQR